MRACYWNLDSGPLWDPWTRELAKWEGSFWRDGGGLSSKWVNMIHLRKHRALSEPKRQFYFKWAMTLWGLSRTRHWCDRLFNIILQSDQWSLLLPTRLVNWFSRFKHIYGDVSNWGASKSSFKVGNPIPANFQLGCCLKSRSTWITSQKKLSGSNLFCTQLTEMSRFSWFWVNCMYISTSTNIELNSELQNLFTPQQCKGLAQLGVNLGKKTKKIYIDCKWCLHAPGGAGEPWSTVPHFLQTRQIPVAARVWVEKKLTTPQITKEYGWP